MEAVQPYMSQVISSLKQEKFSYFLSVENMSEEGLLEHDHINTFEYHNILCNKATGR